MTSRTEAIGVRRQNGCINSYLKTNILSRTHVYNQQTVTPEETAQSLTPLGEGKSKTHP